MKTDGQNGTELRVVKTTSKEPQEISQKKERELAELDRVAKLLIRRDLELALIREKQAQQLQEMDKIAKYLIRRDLELSELRVKREIAFEQLTKRTQELSDSRTALMNILEDIEEARVEAEQERDKTLAIITNFADGLLVFDKESTLALVNPRAEVFFGINGQGLVGKSLQELAGTKEIRSLMKLLGKELKEIFRRELRLEGDMVLEVSTVPIIKEKKKLGALVILHDITREKMIERMKTEFVSLAAHQLRTPLSAIKWTLRMLLDGDLGALSKEQKTFIEKTYLSNERMIALINGLLDVTRIEEGRYLYKTTFARLEDVVQFVVKSYKEEAKKRKLHLRFKKPEKKLPPVRLDVEKIRLAVQNLLDNALRYTRAGGWVTVSLGSDKKELQFRIQDSGAGIPKDQWARVFTKFFRGANVLRMETEGSGLGLFIVKNIIEAHGGRIWFESEENKGTTFYFTIPIPTKQELVRP